MAYNIKRTFFPNYFRDGVDLHREFILVLCNLFFKSRVGLVNFRVTALDEYSAVVLKINFNGEW